MANGDAAAAQGFTVVPATEDFRLGYDGINRAADFAATRVRYFTATTPAGMNALTGTKRGDRCWRSDVLVEYRYDGAAWAPWDSPWQDYAPGYQNVNWNFSLKSYRWAAGRVITRLYGAITGNAGNGQPILIGLPVAATGYAISGRVWMTSGSTRFALLPDIYSAGLLQLRYHSGSSEPVVTTSAPATWGNGDTIAALLEYDA